MSKNATATLTAAAALSGLAVDSITRKSAPLSPTILAAIAGCGGDSKTNQNIPPGVHEVDVTVRIKGLINKGGDYEAAMPAKVNVWDLLNLMATKLNRETVDAVIQSAIDAHEKGEEVPGNAKQYVEDAFKRLAKATKGTKSGSTRWTGTATVVA